MEIVAEGVHIIYKDKHMMNMFCVMVRARGFWQQVSPWFTYRKALVNWCKRHDIDPVNA